MGYDIFVYGNESNYLESYKAFVKDPEMHNPIKCVYLNNDNNRFIAVCHSSEFLSLKPNLSRNCTTTSTLIKPIIQRLPNTFTLIKINEIIYNPKTNSLDFKLHGLFKKPTLSIHINKFFGIAPSKKTPIYIGMFADHKRSRYNFIIS